MTHPDAIATLTSAATTAELAAALTAFTDLREGAGPGTAPGVPDDAPDGQYFNGVHLFTKTGRDLAATMVRDLPDHTADLWAQLDQEQRDARDEQRMADDLAAERRRGRPEVGDRIAVRLPPWRIAVLDRDAKAAGVGRPELIRALISAGYATIRTMGPSRVEAIRTLLQVQATMPTAAEELADRLLAMEHVYRVEIMHPESGGTWNHVHGLTWETSDSYVTAWTYALDVARSHPESRVRVAETDEDGTRYLPVPDVI